MREYPCAFDGCTSRMTSTSSIAITQRGKQRRFCTPTHAAAGILLDIANIPLGGQHAEGVAMAVASLASHVRLHPTAFADHVVTMTLTRKSP